MIKEIKIGFGKSVQFFKKHMELFEGKTIKKINQILKFYYINSTGRISIDYS